MFKEFEINFAENLSEDKVDDGDNETVFLAKSLI